MRLRWFVLVVFLLLTGCQPDSVDSTSTPAAPTDTPVPADSPTPEPPPPTETPEEIVPAEPVDVVFSASDGQELQGRYYPAAKNPSPIVVLMHWVNGDMTDWNEIAPWLQNTGLENPYSNCDVTAPWWDPSWFPPVPAGASYGVFVFTFRDHAVCEGTSAWQPDVWLLDAQAAIKKAAELEGADPMRIATIGSSIGADGAADACAWMNEQTPGACQGALSLSPGGFLNVPYGDAVEDLGEGEDPTPAWCLADPSEYHICDQIPDTANAAYRKFEIQKGNHGNLLLVPEAEPSALQLILDFLAEVFS